ncbi:MAG: PAS domain-containing protein [Eubacterium sp.]|nr:PAS domain-containing protein [Eubacterium sp.]
MLTTNDYDDIAFEVEFMSCVIDRADNLKVLESDSHFSEFTGVHPSKIAKGKLSLLDIINTKDRESFIQHICKKDSPYVYIDFYVKNKAGDYVYVHAIAQNTEKSTLTRLTLADVSRSVKNSEILKKRATSLNRLIDLVEAGVCLFKVSHDMRFEVIYMNKACAKFFGTVMEDTKGRVYRLDEMIYSEDKSAVFQAIGNCMATQTPIDMELRLTPDNEPIWCKLNSAIQRYEENGLPVFHAVFTDISKIKKAEREADSSRDAVVNVFKNLPGPLFYTKYDTPMKLEVVSKDFMRLIGYSRKELFGDMNGDLGALIADGAKKAEKDLRKQAKKHHIIRTEYQLRTKNGKVLDVIDRRRIVDDNGASRTMLGIIKDSSATQIGDVEI